MSIIIIALPYYSNYDSKKKISINYVVWCAAFFVKLAGKNFKMGWECNLEFLAYALAIPVIFNLFAGVEPHGNILLVQRTFVQQLGRLIQKTVPN